MSNLLIAESDPSLLAAMEEYLSERGCVVAPCSDGAEAVEAFKTLPFDGIVLGLKLAKFDGKELLKVFRLSMKGKKTFVLLLANAEDEEAAEATAKKYENVYCLLKPFELDLLQAKLGLLVPKPKKASKGMDPSDLREYLATLSAPKLEFFNESFLKEEDPEWWVPYELTMTGNRYCLLVPKSVEIKQLDQLNNESIKKNMRLWKRKPSGWEKVPLE